MARAAEWEKWEGVLVKVNNVQAFSAPSCILSMGTCNDTTYQRFDVTGDVQVQSQLAAMPTPKIASGDCFSSVTGVVTYFFDYQILPRTTGRDVDRRDVVPEGEHRRRRAATVSTTTATASRTAPTTGASSDAASCRTVMTISAYPERADAADGCRRAANVYVSVLARTTGMPATSKHLWVQSGLHAAANAGIFLLGFGTDIDQRTPREMVNVIGRVVDFNDATGVEHVTQVHAIICHCAGTANRALRARPDQSAASLPVAANGEPAESVLVELQQRARHDARNDRPTTSRRSRRAAPRSSGRRHGSGLTCQARLIVGIWSYNVYTTSTCSFRCCDMTSGSSSGQPGRRHPGGPLAPGDPSSTLTSEANASPPGWRFRWGERATGVCRVR